MSIRFSCAKCGHEIEVADNFAGKHGACKHCGHHLFVPVPASADGEGPLRLRPLDEEPASAHGHLLDPHGPLVIMPATVEPHAKPVAISDFDEPASATRENYKMTVTPDGPHSSAGPPPFWVNAPTLFARSVARTLRTLRDRIYLVSLAALVLALIGFLFKYKGALHVGVVVAIAANIGMFVVGMAYLVTLPFKESFRLGLLNVLIPFYAVYYWYTRWPKMKMPVRKTFGAFLPIVIAGVAFVTYEDGPKIVEATEKEAAVIEEKIEKGVEKLEIGPIKELDKKIEGAVDSPEPKKKEERAR